MDNTSTLSLLIKESLYSMSKNNIPFTPLNYLDIFVETADKLGVGRENLTEILYTKLDNKVPTFEQFRGIFSDLVKDLYKTTYNLEENIKETQEKHQASINNLNMFYDIKPKRAKEYLSYEIENLKHTNFTLLHTLSEAKAELEKQKKRIDELNKYATKDPLTGCYSRRMLNEYLKKSLYNLKRYNIGFSVAMIDIDKFKIINDTYGHNAGDKVLIKLVETTTDNLRQSDILIRYGGDEFFLILNNTNKDQALMVAQKLKTLISHLKFQVKTSLFTITFSIGLTEVSKEEQIDNILNRVDRALYKSKETNKIHIL